MMVRVGVGLKLTGDNVIIGARYNDDNGVNSGSAYIIRNYHDCNQTETHIIDEEYLINWQCTVCVPCIDIDNDDDMLPPCHPIPCVVGIHKSR